MGEFAKRLRRGIKDPLKSAVAWAAARGLDTRERTLEEIRGLAPRSIVVSRTDRIGDLLVSSVMIDALHRRWPAARLVVIGGPRNRAALEGMPFVEAGPVFRRAPGSWRELRRWLPAQGFELAMSLQAESVAGAVIAAWSRAPVRAVTHASQVLPAFNFHFGFDDRHHVTRFCRAAAAIGAPCAAPRPAYVVPDAARRAVAEVAREWTRAGQPVVVVQVPNRSSRRHRSRAWPAEHIVTLAGALAQRGRTVVLFAFGAEREEGIAIRSGMPWVHLAPMGPLAEAAALLEHADVFVSGYTGTYHLADAVGTSTVLIGSAHYAEYWRALGVQHRYALADSAEDVAPEPVLEAIEDLIRARAGAAGARR